jgi:hypothetical protein
VRPYKNRILQGEEYTQGATVGAQARVVKSMLFVGFGNIFLAQKRIK